MPPSALGNGMLQGGSLVLLLPLYNLHALKHINNVVNTAALHAQFQRSLVQGNDGGAALAIFPQKALTQETQGLVLAAVCQLRSIHPAACMHTDVLTHNASTSRTQPVHQKIGVDQSFPGALPLWREIQKYVHMLRLLDCTGCCGGPEPEHRLYSQSATV